MTKKDVYGLLNEATKMYTEDGRYYAGIHNDEAARAVLLKIEALQDFVFYVQNWRNKK